ncbi:MAG: 50S ribosomal protein L18 [Patescibacteria group bacterium]
MKNYQKIKQEKIYSRVRRTRAKIKGTKERPRLCVKRSLKHIYAQLIDDQQGKTLAAASDLELKKPDLTALKTDYKAKEKIAYAVGLLLARKARDKKIEKVVFDRREYKFHGRIKALAEGAREEKLIF